MRNFKKCKSRSYKEIRRAQDHCFYMMRAAKTAKRRNELFERYGYLIEYEVAWQSFY